MVAAAKVTLLSGLIALGVLYSAACEKGTAEVAPIEKDQFFDFVLSLGKAHAFNPEKLAPLTGLSFTEDRHPSNDHYSRHYSLEDPRERHPFIERIELRSPLDEGNPGGLMIIELRNTSHISSRDVMTRFGEVADLIVPHPEQPVDDPVSLVYEFEWGELRFGCSRGEADSLVSVVLDAYESAAFERYKDTLGSLYSRIRSSRDRRPTA